MKTHIHLFALAIALCATASCALAQNTDTPDELCGVNLNSANPVDVIGGLKKCAEGAPKFIDASGWQISEVVTVPPKYIKETFKNCDGSKDLPQQEWQACNAGIGSDTSQTWSISVGLTGGVEWEQGPAKYSSSFTTTGTASVTMSTASDKAITLKTKSIPKCQLAAVGYRTLKCRKTQYVSYGVCWGKTSLDNLLNLTPFQGASKVKLVQFDYTKCQTRVYDPHKCPGCACK